MVNLTPFRNTFPAAAPADAHWTDTVITEGHVAACCQFGHADWTVDGVVLPRCPRCGEVKTPTTTPILAGLIAAGHIVVTDHEYVGTASDGVEVRIGSDHAPELAERYLTDHATPESW